MEVKNYNLRFSGTKAELYVELKKWCDKSGKSVNGTVVELIDKFIKKQK